jgi:hypothetical protein
MLHDKSGCLAHPSRFETLEPRALFSIAVSPGAALASASPQAIHQALASAASSADGTYSGSVTVNRPDGTKVTVPTTATLKTGTDGKTKVKFSIPIGGLNARPSFKTLLSPSGSHFLVGTIPSDVGDGLVQVKDGKSLSISGDIDPGFLDPIPFSFSGTKSAGAAPLAESVTTLSTKNPILGTYKGTITNAFSQASYSVSVQVALNKLGHPTLHLQAGVSAELEVDIDMVIHPHLTGSFSQLLGSTTADGSISGHLTHTGRLVFTTFGISVGTTTGSLKRLT